MRFCPKCGMIIEENTKKCPKCNTEIINENIEVLDLPPKNNSNNETTSKKEEKTKNKKTEENPNSKTKEKQKKTFVPGSIPLKVKKTTKPRKKEISNKNNFKKTLDENKREFTLLNISLIVKVCIIVFLLIITVIIIFDTALYKDGRADLTQNNVKVEKSSIYNDWVTENDSLFEFKKDFTFYWYEQANKKKDNYYKGTYTFKKGTEALEEMGYNEEEFVKEFGENINKENIYSIEMIPKTSFINGQDTTETNIPKDTRWWYILIIKDDGTAIAYNKTLDTRYQLIKK